MPGIGSSDEFEVLQSSSQTATGAIIFHVASLRGTKLAIVKTPRNPGSDHAIATEWDNVNELHQDSRSGSLLPAPLARFEVDGAVFYAYRAIAGRTMFSRFRNRIVASRTGMLERFARQALPAALRLHAAHTRMVDGESLALALQTDFDLLKSLVDLVPDAVEKSVSTEVAYLSGSGLRLPMGRIHGDFSAYNILTSSRSDSACSGIIDWEHSEVDQPQHLDILRFISGTEFMGRRAFEGAAALRRMSRAGNPVAGAIWEPWLAAMAPGCEITSDSRAYAALWMHFWVHAAYREQHRQSDPANVFKTTYFRSLCELAST